MFWNHVFKGVKIIKINRDIYNILYYNIIKYIRGVVWLRLLN